MTPPRLLLTANSPGEIAGWVHPFVEAWHKIPDAWPVDLLLLPCTFATGHEGRVARNIPGISKVWRTSDLPRLLLSGGASYRTGALLHFGGDLMYSALLGWRWGLDCWSYLWTRPWWNRLFKGFFTKDDWGVRWLLERRVPEKKIHLVGDLVLDAVRSKTEEPALARERQISYLPGSRTHELGALTPFFLAIHRRVEESLGPIRGILHLSPFVPPEVWEGLVQSAPDGKLGGERGRLSGKDLTTLGEETKLEIVAEGGLAVEGRSLLSVSIPGTKTAEAGYLRTPVLTILPLNRPEKLPSLGVLGLLDLLPGGEHIKGRLLLLGRKRLSYLAHPNIKAQSYLMDELIDELTVESVAEAIVEAISNPSHLEQVQTRLRDLYPWNRHPSAEIAYRIRGLDR